MNFQDLRWRFAPLLVVVAAGAVFAAKHPVIHGPQFKPVAPVPVLPVQETLKPVAPALAVTMEKPMVIETKVTAAPFTLTASMESSSAEGQPAILHLALHNSGKERLMIGGSAFEQSAFHLTVTNSTGQAVPRTADGERVLTPPMAVSANATVLVGPEQTINYRFNLARLFDLSRAGVYHVSASRTVAPWAFNLPAPVAGQPARPKQADLILKPLTFRMAEGVASASGPVALAPPPSRQTFLYVASRYSDGISHYLIKEDGSLSFSTASSPLGSPHVAMGADSLAATPDGRFLYVGNGTNHTVSQFRVGDNGVLSPLSPPTVPAHFIPGPLLMDPKGRFLYNLSGTVYAIGPDGRLTVTASVANNPPGRIEYSDKGNVVASYSGAIDPAGTVLYTCGGLTCGQRLAPDGTVTALPCPASGSLGPNGGNDNAVALSPSGKFAFAGVSSQNASGGFDRVVPLRVQADGTLTPLPGLVQTPQAPPLPSPGFQPFFCTALAVDPTGRFLVVVNPSYVDCYRIGQGGAITFLSMTTQQGDLSSVFFGPVADLIYILNRNANSLTAFRLDDQHGLIPSGLDVTTDVPFDAKITSAVACTPLNWGAAAGGISVSASLRGDVLPTNAPVVLTVFLKNITTHPIALGESGADMASFRLSLSGPQRQAPGVLRGGGEPVAAPGPLLAAGHDLFDAPGRGGAELTLPPGQQRQYRFLLSRLADLTVASNYTVQITRTLPGGTAAASPVVPFLLDGPYNGVTRGDLFQGVSVL